MWLNNILNKAMVIQTDWSAVNSSGALPDIATYMYMYMNIHVQFMGPAFATCFHFLSH